MTHRSYSNQGLFSLALASRGLAPTRIVHEAEMFESRPSVFATLKAFVAMAIGLPRITS